MFSILLDEEIDGLESNPPSLSVPNSPGPDAQSQEDVALTCSICSKQFELTQDLPGFQLFAVPVCLILRNIKDNLIRTLSAVSMAVPLTSSDHVNCVKVPFAKIILGKMTANKIRQLQRMKYLRTQ